jgi:hypothetical protein
MQIQNIFESQHGFLKHGPFEQRFLRLLPEITNGQSTCGDRTFIGLCFARNNLQNGGFSGTIGSDKPDATFSTNGPGNTVEDCVSTERDGYVVELYDG